MSPSDDSARGTNAPPEPLDPIHVVQQNPGWFFRSGQFEWQTAVALLQTEALLSSPIRQMQLMRVGGWIVLTGDVDWLRGDLEPFTSPTIFEEGGPNSTRVEVLLTAFCDAVSTASYGQRSDVRAIGQRDMPALVTAALDRQDVARTIAFQIPGPDIPTSTGEFPMATTRIIGAVRGFEDRVREFEYA